MREHFWKILALSALAVLGLREIGNLVSPATGYAQSSGGSRYFVEPGTTVIPVDGGGTVQGKVFIDLQTGDTFGFPVFGPKTPYPGRQVSEDRPLVVNPVYLGRFNLSANRR
jgi:hypothetical protein